MRPTHPTPSVLRSTLRTVGAVPALLVASLLAGAPALAQTGSAATPPVASEVVRTLEQRTERIVHEDAGSRIEELRVGGQTRTISVQTNTDVPGYQVQPLDAGRTDGGLGQRPGNTGRSTWRLLNF